MIVDEVLQQLETATHPVAKVLHKADGTKVLLMAFKKGMVLKEHVTLLPATILVIKGELLYEEAGKEVVLKPFDNYAIPVKTPHAVFCIEDAICLLIQA